MLDHEYEINRDGDVVALDLQEVGAGPRDVRDFEIAPREDEALLLAVAVAIDELAG